MTNELVPITDTTLAIADQVDLTLPLGEFVRSVYAATGNNPNTARSYAQAIGQFLMWFPDDLPLAERQRIPEDWLPLAETGEQVLEDSRGRSYSKTEWIYRGTVAVLRGVKAGNLDNFCAYLDLNGLTPATVDNRLRAVRTMLSVAYRDGILTTEQASRMALKPYKRRSSRHTKLVGRRLSPGEVQTLRATVTKKARHGSKKLRDRAILDTMLYAALRRFEVASLTTGSFIQDGGRWWLIVERGKGNKTRRVKVHDTLFKSLAAWCEVAGLEIGQYDEPLFYNLTKGGNFTGNGKRRPLSASVIGRLVGEYGYLAGLAPEAGKNTLGAHDLRRTCARNARDNGADLPQVQALLGHSDPKTTMNYIGELENEGTTAVDMVKY